jgi:predicted glutamine amidotransferase
VRRGGPPADHPHAPEYDISVDEMAAMRPLAAVGHVRAATSGHSGIPNPHPFQHRGMLFAHNGGISSSALQQRLGGYLVTHPPDYTPGTPGTSYIDSELYFLYLLKLVDERPGLPFGEALPLALQALVADTEVVGGSPAINFVLTDGDTLYALHYYGTGNANPVRYYPVFDGTPEASPYWAVASEPVGGSAEGWASIPPRTLGIFVPGRAPVFRSVADPGMPAFSFRDVAVAPFTDEDADGWASALDLACDPDAQWGTWEVSLEVAASPDGETWTDLFSTRAFTIRQSEPDTVRNVVHVLPDTLGPTRWDLRLRLREMQTQSVVLTVLPENFPPLGQRRVEGAARDTVSDRPRAYRFAAVERTGGEDRDGDGHLRSFTLRWDADLIASDDSARAYVKVIGVEQMNYMVLGTSAPFPLRGQAPDPVEFAVTVTPAGRPPARWDLFLELYDADADTLGAVARPEAFTALSQVPVEGARHDQPEPPAFDFAWVGVVAGEDRDGDGHARSLTLRWDADWGGPGDSARAYVRLLRAGGGGTVLGASEEFVLRGQERDTLSLALAVPPETPPEAWDLRLELYDVPADTVVAQAGPEDFPALSGVRVEGALPDGPAGVGEVRPNPAPGEVWIPVKLEGAAEVPVSLEIFDAAGRLIGREGPVLRAPSYAGLLHWSGRRAASGVYFCRVRVGDATHWRRAVLVR